MKIDPKLLDDGMCAAEIARELGLTKSNVHTIMQRAMTKLRLQAIAKGVDKKDYVEDSCEYHDTLGG